MRLHSFFSCFLKIGFVGLESFTLQPFAYGQMIYRLIAFQQFFSVNVSA